MSFCCAFVLLVGLARARCPSKFAYVRRAFYSNRRAPGDMRAKKASRVLARERASMPPGWRQSARRRAVAWPGKPARALAAQPGLAPRAARRFMAVPGALALRLRLTEELLMAARAHISRWAAR